MSVNKTTFLGGKAEQDRFNANIAANHHHAETQIRGRGKHVNKHIRLYKQRKQRALYKGRNTRDTRPRTMPSVDGMNWCAPLSTHSQFSLSLALYF